MNKEYVGLLQTMAGENPQLKRHMLARRYGKHHENLEELVFMGLVLNITPEESVSDHDLFITTDKGNEIAWR